MTNHKPKMKVEKEQWIEESLFNLGHHHKATISDGEHKVEGRGRTEDEAKEIAKDKWHNKYGCR